jgi:hypothetical protein
MHLENYMSTFNSMYSGNESVLYTYEETREQIWAKVKCNFQECWRFCIFWSKVTNTLSHKKITNRKVLHKISQYTYLTGVRAWAVNGKLRIKCVREYDESE